MEQSPNDSMVIALSLLMDALTTEEFLNHFNVDVKVGMALGLSEITIITVPDAPYNDDKMVFPRLSSGRVLSCWI